MIFLSIFCALLIEQIKPLRADNWIYSFVKLLAMYIKGWLNAGHESQGRIAWIVIMLILMVPTIIVYWFCVQFSLVAALFWNILIAYLTLGFRHYSHYFTSIQMALDNGNVDVARMLLAEWTKQDADDIDVSEISRVAVEKALITAHRNVFGVFFWFLLPLGAAGAIMYRVSEYLARAWNDTHYLQNDNFGHFANVAFYWIDWLPARLTATAFAVVGNFEDAIYAWRNVSHQWKDEAIGIILSAGGGAMGLRLGAWHANVAEVAREGDLNAPDPVVRDLLIIESEKVGREVGTRALQGAVGLVWRALLLWMFLLLLWSLAI